MNLFSVDEVCTLWGFYAE